MSRVAKSPVAIPGGVEVKLNGQQIAVKGCQRSAGAERSSER